MKYVVIEHIPPPSPISGSHVRGKYETEREAEAERTALVEQEMAWRYYGCGRGSRFNVWIQREDTDE